MFLVLRKSYKGAGQFLKHFGKVNTSLGTLLQPRRQSQSTYTLSDSLSDVLTHSQPKANYLMSVFHQLKFLPVFLFMTSTVTLTPSWDQSHVTTNAPTVSQALIILDLKTNSTLPSHQHDWKLLMTLLSLLKLSTFLQLKTFSKLTLTCLSYSQWAP